MPNFNSYRAAKEKVCEFEVLYTHAPGYCTTITAIPQRRWDVDETGNMSESYRCIREMVVTLLDQLPQEQRNLLLDLCNDLYPRDTYSVVDGGVVYD